MRSGVRQWESDASYFDTHKPQLLRKYRNKYVAIWRGKVVDTDEDRVALTERVYSRYGYKPIFFAEVTAKPKPVIFPNITILHHSAQNA
jgi:hypothetical protein